jgi:hypothetical protein
LSRWILTGRCGPVFGLETRAEESMHVGVHQAILAAVLMDREDALGSASGVPKVIPRGR